MYVVVDYILRQLVHTINEKEIVVKPGKTNRDRHKYPTDLDYADDIALTSTLLKDAQDLLTSVENASAKVGFFLNAMKTEYMTVNEEAEHLPILSNDGSELNAVKDFKYLGSYVADPMKDFMISKGQAWDACNS